MRPLDRDESRVTRCETCSGPMDQGSLLVSSTTYWSTTDRLALIPQHAFHAVASGRGPYFGRPWQISGNRCTRCSICRVGFAAGCTHDLEEGRLFPQTSLHWVSGDSRFTPNFLWPFVHRGRDGVATEVLVRVGIRLTASSRFCRGARCTRCGGVVLRYGDAEGGLR
jgi:hypothetical protein